MKMKINLSSALLGAILVSFTGATMAEMTVDKSQGQLNITSDIDGTVIAKIIGPDDVVVLDDQYQGNSFIWSPSSGPDGAYRYDVRVIAPAESSDSNDVNTKKHETASRSNYAGGSVEVTNGAIAVPVEEK